MDPLQTLEHVHSLYEAGLFPSAKWLAGMLLSALPPNGMHLGIEVEALTVFADCLTQNDEHYRARKYYEKALQIQKSLSSASRHKEISFDVELRIKYATCCIKAKEYILAKSVLEEIPEEMRGIKAMMLMASIEEKFGDTRTAINCYKTILKKQPYAVEAYIGLLHHNVPIHDLFIFMASTQNSPWLKMYVEARSHNMGFAYDRAIENFRTLNSTFRHNVDCLVHLAESYYKKFQPVEASNIYTQIRTIDRYVVDGMDQFVELLKEQNHLLQVNQIANELHEYSSERPECWVAMAHYCDMKGEREKAMLFIDKALFINKKHMPAIKLKATLLLEQRRDNDAIDANDANNSNDDGYVYDALREFRKAYLLQKDLFIFHGLVDCYIKIKENGRAYTTAEEAVKLMPTNAAALTLLGIATSIYSGIDGKPHEYFEKALAYDPKCIKPVFSLVNLYVDQKKIPEAINILEKYSVHHHDSALYQTRLGDIYQGVGEFAKAMDHYHAALRISPEFGQAKHGIRELEDSWNIRYIDEEDDEDGDFSRDQAMTSDLEENL